MAAAAFPVGFSGPWLVFFFICSLETTRTTPPPGMAARLGSGFGFTILSVAFAFSGDVRYMMHAYIADVSVDEFRDASGSYAGESRVNGHQSC